MYLLDDQNKVHFIKESDIYSIEVSRNKRCYRTINGKFRAPRTLKEFEMIFEPLGFMLIDKKKLVNLKLAIKFENGFIHMVDCKHAVSRRKSEKVKKMMDEYHPN